MSEPGGLVLRSDHWRVTPLTPPGPPFVRGGKGGAGRSLSRGASIGSLAGGSAVHPSILNSEAARLHSCTHALRQPNHGLVQLRVTPPAGWREAGTRLTGILAGAF